MSRNGETVRAFEEAFAEYVGARHAVALCNGTATLHTALVALGVQPGDRVAVPPLTMSSTTLAVLHAGAVPVFCDVRPDTWLMDYANTNERMAALIPVSLYGLHQPWNGPRVIDDAAQTLRPHIGAAFTSYSLQASKIISTSEGGVLVTNDEELAVRAREFSSLGYRMRADQPRIESATLKAPTFDRHHSIGWNYRMADPVAQVGLKRLRCADGLKAERHDCAELYADAVAGCAWMQLQSVSSEYDHDYWAFAVACDTPERALWLADAMERHGGERPFFCWKLAYMEPFMDGQYVTMSMGGIPVTTNDPYGFCPIAEDLQPRLVQMQTNDLASAERNARALRRAIQEAA